LKHLHFCSSIFSCLTVTAVRNHLINSLQLLGKTQVSHRIDKTLDKSLYRGGNPHLTNRFCKDELGPKFQHGIRACWIQGPPPFPCTKSKEYWRERGVLGKIQVSHRICKTLDKSLYRGGNSHLTSQFCKDDLGSKFQQQLLSATNYHKIYLTFAPPSLSTSCS